MQLSGIMQARKKLLFAALFIAILVPIFFALALRSQLAVINPADESPLITWLQQNMTSGGFWMKETGDGTSYSLVLLANNSRIGTLLFLQSHAWHRGHVHSTLVDAVLQKILSCAVYDRLCAFVRAHLLSHHG